MSVVGAVSHAAFGYYEQDERRYIELASDYHHEITSFTGNVRARWQAVPARARRLRQPRRRIGGGHVLPGCTVFVGEVTIREMSDVELQRVPDEVTGLALWPLRDR